MIIITGTPGTGKTSVAKELKRLNFKIVNFNKEIEKCNLIVGYDKKRKSKIVDENKLSDCYKKYDYNCVVESHLSHFIDPKYVETSVVLKCNPKELRKRLKKKGWSKEKIEENIESEIMDICLNETIEMKHKPIVIDTTNKKPKEVAEIIMYNHMVNLLNKKYKIKIKVGNPTKTLIRCILSQRTKDEITDEVSRRLFKHSIKEISEMKVSQIENIIKKVGFYRQKAKCIKHISKFALKNKIPKDRNELLKLPCVGKKTADITLSYGFGIPVIAIDVHVKTISERWGINGDYDEMQEKLHNIFPEDRRLIVNKLLVEFGKDTCQTRKPKCENCIIKNWCKYYGRRHPRDN